MAVAVADTCTELVHRLLSVSFQLGIEISKLQFDFL